MHSIYLDAIRTFEGFAPQAQWDYAQFSNGFGTRAKFAGEVIDRVEANRRFEAAISSARAVVEKQAPHLDEGTKAALTSLTFNAGESWVNAGLGEAVRRGDLAAVRTIFQQYNKAGGEVLPGLVSRRAAEALWIGNPGAAGDGVATMALAAAQKIEKAGAVADAVSAVSGGEGATAVSLAALDAARARDAAQPALLTSASFSDIARQVQLNNGHELLSLREESRADRERRGQA